MSQQHYYQNPATGKKYYFNNEEEWSIWKWIRPEQQSQYLELNAAARKAFDQDTHKYMDKYGKDPAYWPDANLIFLGKDPDPAKWKQQWSEHPYDNSTWSRLTPGVPGGTGLVPDWLFWTLIAGGGVLLVVLLWAIFF
jgi:hypothetical protein